ncbi:CBS domain-containing protein [Pseudomonas sp. MOB-449]|nr:CBS domain-containing protein [Pseudomonas sp. MOB-449]
MLTVTPQETAQHGMQLMTRFHMRHLLAVEGGALVGLVSIGDLVREVRSEQ